MSKRRKSLRDYLSKKERIDIKTKEEDFQKQVKKTYPECARCSFLEKRKANDEIYCFYRNKDKCLLKNK